MNRAECADERRGLKFCFKVHVRCARGLVGCHASTRSLAKRLQVHRL
jgi:hypothetical protein